MIYRLRSLLKEDGYKSRAVRGTAISLLSVGGENALRLLSNLILTRLLFPEAFGMMVLVQVVIYGAAMFTDFGFRDAVVQDKRGDQPDFLNTVFTLQILRGLFLTLVITVAAEPFADFYGEPQLADLLMAAAFVPLIQGFNSTRIFTAERHIQLERVTLIRIGAQIIGLILTVSFAWWLQSVWALVIGNLIGAFCFAIMSHTLLKGSANQLQLDKSSVSNLLRFGGFIFVASLAGFFSNQGDRAILGKFVSLEALALFHIAMMFAALPKQLTIIINVRVLFPLYARRPPADSSNNRRQINKARRLITTMLLGVVGLFGLIGDTLVRVLYDVRYEAAGPYLVLISLSLMPLIITHSYHRFPVAVGHSGRYAMFQISLAAVQFVLLLALVPQMGILGAIIAVPASIILAYPALVYIILPYKGWDPLHDAGAFGMALLICAVVLWVNAATVTPLFFRN